MEGALDIAAEIPMSSLILDLKAGDQHVVFQEYVSLPTLRYITGFTFKASIKKVLWMYEWMAGWMDGKGLLC